MKEKPWTLGDEAWLADNFGKIEVSIRAMAKHLGTSPMRVEKKALAMGLVRDQAAADAARRPWDKNPNPVSTLATPDDRERLWFSLSSWSPPGVSRREKIASEYEKQRQRRAVIRALEYGE
jgi:hypothetical protein